VIGKKLDQYSLVARYNQNNLCDFLGILTTKLRLYIIGLFFDDRIELTGFTFMFKIVYNQSIVRTIGCFLH